LMDIILKIVGQEGRQYFQRDCIIF